MPVVHLFRDRRAIGTLLLWIMFFCNLLDLFFLQNWLPVLLGDNGIAVTQAVFIGGLFQFGGVAAALATGFFIDRFTGYLVLPALYALGCALVLLLGQGGSQTTMTVLTFIAGFCIVGAQASANAHAAMFYPTFIRSTGVGWCLGIGRLGAIIGPLLAGLLLSLHWPVASLFILLSLPLATACVAVLIMGALYAKGRTLAETLTAATSEPAK
jgi:AAHS family 4-hydroxybenzoate transporter-like MFS transporter